MGIDSQPSGPSSNAESGPVGGMRSTPSTTGSTSCPEDSTDILDGSSSSVRRRSLGLRAWRYSVTLPERETRSPTAVARVTLLPYTRSPLDTRGSLEGSPTSQTPYLSYASLKFSLRVCKYKSWAHLGHHNTCDLVHCLSCQGRLECAALNVGDTRRMNEIRKDGERNSKEALRMSCHIRRWTTLSVVVVEVRTVAGQQSCPLSETAACLRDASDAHRHVGEQ